MCLQMPTGDMQYSTLCCSEHPTCCLPLLGAELNDEEAGCVVDRLTEANLE